MTSAVAVVVGLLLASSVLVWPRPSAAACVHAGHGRPAAAFGDPDLGDPDLGDPDLSEARRREPGRREAGRRMRGSPRERPVQAWQVADSADLIAVSLRAGAPVVDAVDRVALASSDAVGRDLRSAAAALRWGLTGRAAWQASSPAWEPVARALTLAAAAGVPPVALLEQSADDLRRAEAARLEQAVATLGVRVVVPLGVAFLPAFLLTTVLPLVLALAGQVLRGD